MPFPLFRWITAILSVALIVSNNRADDWPDFLGPRRDGKSLEAGIVVPWPAEGPQVLWQISLGTSYGAAVVAQGRLYHFDRFGDVARLTCRDSATGKELWRAEHPTAYEDMLGYNNGPRCSPVVDGDHVYTCGAEGVLRCLDARDGKLRWSRDTLRDFDVVPNFFGVGSTPLIWEDLLIANIGGSPADGPQNITEGELEGNGTGVVAFDKLTGDVRWKASNELASYASPVVAVMNGRPTCFVFARGGLVALDPANGKVLFQFPWRAKKFESVNASSPVVVSDEVFLSEAYGPGSVLLKVAGDSATPLWSDQDKGRGKSLELHWNTPIHHEGFLYASTGQHGESAALRCVEWRTGKVMWTESAPGRASLTYVDGHLICLTEEGTLRLLRTNPQRYEPVSTCVLRNETGDALLTRPAWSAPVIADGRLFVRGANRLVCLRLMGGGE